MSTVGWNDAEEVVVAGSGQVYFAPVGTALPAIGAKVDAALDKAFMGAGYITEDGATLSVGSEVTDFMAWQSRQAIRRDKQTQEIQFSFTFQQWNEENIPFAFGGGEVKKAETGLYSYTFPEGDDALDERSLIVDAVDGDVNFRFVFPRGNVVESVETAFKRTETAQLPITFKLLEPVGGGAPAYFNTNAPGFVTGS